MGRNAALLGLLAGSTLGAPGAAAQWSTSSLSAARQGLAATAVDGLAIFAGGRKPGALSAEVDLYDSASGAWTAASLTVARAELAATPVGPYALFAGGAVAGGQATDVIDVLDVRTLTWSTASLSLPRFYLAATTVGTKALFVGGSSGSLGASVPSAVVDIYDASLGPPSSPAAWSTASLSLARGGICAATVGGRAIFAGGFNGTTTMYATVDIYDDATGLWTIDSLSQARVLNAHASATVGDRAYFGGGFLSPVGPASDRVDIYDAATGAWTTAMLSEPRGFLAAAAVGNSVFFAGGLKSAFVGTATVDTFHAGTGAWTAAPNLTSARWELGAASVGGRALFAGGVDAAGAQYAVVDIYDARIGAAYCTPAVANSSGSPGALIAFGSDSVSEFDLTLDARQLPQGTFGYFVTSLAQGFAANPGGSQGHLCLSGSIGRYRGAGQVLNSGLNGAFSLALDLTAMPQPLGSVAAQAGETWNFQAWYRDANPMVTSNFTDAVAVTLQ